MTSETELRKWLHRDDKSHIENIEFGMKVWNSIEFNLLTKHEIITEEICKILVELSGELKTEKDVDAAWTIINEFLALKCSPGAIVSSVKLTLTTTLLEVIKHVQCQRYIVYKGLITLLQNSSMQSFFKSNSKPFALLAGASIDLLTKLLIESNDIDLGCDLNDPFIYEVLKITKNYIKQTPFLNQFRKPFVKHLLIPLSEWFISSRKEGIIDESEYFNILHEIYFADNENQNPINQFLVDPEKDENKFLLDVPIHVFMLIVEGIFQPLKVDTATQALFIQFLFNDYFKESNDKFDNEKEMLLMMSLFLSVLKRYDVSLNFDIDGLKAVVYIGKHLENLTVTESNLYEVLSILCASIELNPMMLEHSIIPIVVKCMLHRKEDKTTKMLERFLMLVIDMYRRLSRSEKFISIFMRSMWQKLSEYKLSKKLKRKIGTVDVEESPKKLRLDSVGNDSSLISFNKSVKDVFNRSQWFLQLIRQQLDPPDVKILDSNINEPLFQWKNIQFAWPNRVGEAFSKFISGLVSKPSLVVWKTLIFTLTDYIKLLKEGDLSENTLFLVDWTSALLCQYFDGCRLAEQSDKTWEMIDINRKLQRNLLKDFGDAILSQEHNIRTMNAFLSLCYSSGNFDLLSWFYCPDSITTEQIEHSMADHSNQFVHSYLQPTEWVLIEQRITNFGKHECRTNLNRLYIQKIKSKLMFKQSNETIDMANHVLASTLADDGLNELNEILLDDTTNQWFIGQLTRAQKIKIARGIVELDGDKDRNSCIIGKLVKSVQDQEFFDILTVAVFEKIGMETSDPTLFLKRINFDDVFAGDESVCKDLFRGKRCSTAGAAMPEQQSELRETLKLLEVLPIGFVSLSIKNILLHFTLSLLRSSPKANIHCYCQNLKKLLLQGDTPDVFRHLKVKQLPRIFDNDLGVSENDLQVIFKLIFEKSLVELTPSTSKMLTELLDLLKTETYEKRQRWSYMDMVIQLLDYLYKNKKCKEIATQYRDGVLEKIREYFDEKIDRSPDDEQYFALKTTSGFVHIISTVSEFDDPLKRIINIYVKNMQNCYESHSIKLLNLIVTNKSIFGYADSDITKVMDKFWNILISDLNKVGDPDVYQSFLKFVLNFKSPEEIIDMLTGMNSVNNDSDDVIQKFQKFEKLFRLIFKCQMNKAKGSICSEFFRQVSFQIIIKLRTSPQTQYNVRLQLLDCQKHLCANIQIPVSIDLIDDIICFMSETIKYQQIKTITDTSILKETHGRISDLCYSLIQYRHFFIVDRIPQFVIILKELLQSVCWYKCNRSRGKHLDDDEVTTLAELSHKLENIIKAFVKHAKDVKRIAPYFLLFIINLMISKENVSTMYSKIKTHFDYMCYDLISVCDHRVEGFIMRNCNEASKQSYETMVKEYNKYHKFRGKV